ncbi:glycosyltransferase family 4 protein [Metabacillus iocasae]|uniref:Glycosyltransferase involved in cell wall biosynthesis n=1 Tax=Priestia iocasae TaxID=2291674 RepID=A0ABS2QR57_9BACI|nr:glycosyltransferase family 4 protein [Metabacillus iocasae]MBM7701527.1 glycosyltransferase involved in cell wall biosynthesis [Metabacillus iocasae]
MKKEYENKMDRNGQSTSQPLCILMLSWEFPPHIIGGLARHVFDLSRAFARVGHDVHVITAFVEGLPVYERLYGVHVYRVKSLQPHHEDFLAWVSSLNIAMTQKVLKLSESLSFDLIHAHDWLVGASARALKKNINRPLITTIHATEHGRNNGIFTEMQRSIHDQEHSLIQDSEAIIVCSNYMKAEITRLFHVLEQKVSVFPNGIDVDMIVSHTRSLKIKDKFQIHPGPLVFSIGRIVYEKGFSVLIEATEQLVKTIPDIRIVIAGKGPLLHHYRANVIEKNLQQHVYFVGYITDEERNQLFHLCDVAVFPSLYEPFGIVALEGMVVGRPTIVSDTGGLSSIVTHEVTGLLCKPGDVSSLAQGLMRVLSDPLFSAMIGANAKKEVTGKFGWDEIASKTSELFKCKVSKNKAGKEEAN